VAWAGERRRPYREYGQVFRRTHDAKDPGPSGCVAAGARGVAALDHIAYTLFAVGTLSLPTLADRLAGTQRSRFRLALTCSCLALLLMCWLAAPASAASLTVLAPASATPGLKALAEQFSAKTGIAVTIGGGGRDKVFEALRTGSPADVVVLPTSDLIETPRATGMMPLGHIPVGVGVKAGTKIPDVSTPEKFRAALLAARGVAYADPKAGTSAGKIIDQMLSASDFARVKRVPVQGLAVNALLSGQADIALQMLPELAANKDVALAGPVPDIYGASVDFSAGIAVQSVSAIEASAFISFLTDPQNAAVWKNNGLTPLGQ
jgi:molybdate transport system substrate-binding protein